MQRLTDLCDHCEVGNALKNSIARTLKDENYMLQESNESESLEKATIFFKAKAIDLSSQFEASADETLKAEININYEKYKQLVTDLTDYNAVLFTKT